ncbi:MAG TPA: DUF4097 family beta strand repeat-containing protein [Acidisarcina sp.]|nr:DUF4097 family beta strand repeat-containing protein [Acidisarcina sp.]
MRPSISLAIPAITAAALLLVPACVFAADGTFDKTLNVNGNVFLEISTGSGYIHVTPGSDNQVHIIGHVKSSGNWSLFGSSRSAEDRVNEVVGHPPIDQTGNIIRVGKESHSLNNVSIDYDVTAPRGTALSANSGSGDLRITDVGKNVKFSTGSGNIEAHGISGTLSLETGSGNITASQSGSGDVKAGTGSGDIHLQNIDGGLKAETGSGSIEVSGKPSSGWKVGTGSGDVTLSTGNAAFNLDASSGSGDIRADVSLAAEGSPNRHHVTGKVNGGGPVVRVETGSGSIHIH